MPWQSLAGFERRWPTIAVIAALHYATLMALPLTLVTLGSEFAILPILTGFFLELVRSAVRRKLRREVRAESLSRAAEHALDRQTVVPEADLDLAFWAAGLVEYALTVDIPAVAAAAFAAVSVLLLVYHSVDRSLLGSLIALIGVTGVLSIWSNRRRTRAVDIVVAARQRAAAWVAAAERDAGEIYGANARAPFLARLRESVLAWSVAEERLERNCVRHRMLLGGMFLLGLWLILKIQRIDPFHLELDRSLSLRGVSSMLLLGCGLPIAYVFTVHADSLFSAFAALKQIAPGPRASDRARRKLTRRATRLRARSLSFAYPSAVERQVLRELSLDVDLTRIALIVAPNGAGKTTLARLICGVLVPDSGALELDGIACSELDRDELAFVPQNPLLVESLSIEENVRLVAPDVSREMIGERLAELGLAHPIEQRAAQLSRGEQRRVAIARALLKAPRLLLLDEPDAWLDARGRRQLSDVLAKEATSRAVVVISHRNDWLPPDASVIDLADQVVAPVGTSRACG